MTVMKEIFYTLWCFICGLFSQSREEPAAKTAPFSASDYLDRMEKENLKLLEQREPVDRVIILWWGLDGLRLNEDGTLEWISRKKPEPVNTGAFYQPVPMMERTSYPLNYRNMCQSPQMQNNLMLAQMQIAQNSCIIRQLQNQYHTLQQSQYQQLIDGCGLLNN